MKKRLISLALTLALCLGLAVPAFAVDTSGLDANGAKAYLEVLNKQIAAYGIITDTYAPSGIMYTALEDMNADGTPELIIFAGKQGDGGDIFVWTLRNGKVVQTVNAIGEIDYSGQIIFTNVSLARRLGETAVCVRTDVRQYHEDGSSGLYAEEYRIYHFDGTKETFAAEDFDEPWTLADEEFGGDGIDVGYWYGDKGVSTRAVQSALTAKAASVSSGGFTDVNPTAYYANAVKWAVDRKITSGTSATTFSPEKTCSVAEILTFLWNANGKPEPTGRNPFSDISTGDYFYKAAVWAAGKGLVSGNKLNPSTPCTRAMVMEYLWKLAGSPKATQNSKNYAPYTITPKTWGGSDNIQLEAAIVERATVTLCQDEEEIRVNDADSSGVDFTGEVIHGKKLTKQVTKVTIRPGSMVTINHTFFLNQEEKNAFLGDHYEVDSNGVFHFVDLFNMDGAMSIVHAGRKDTPGTAVLMHDEDYFIVVATDSTFSDVPASAAYAQAVTWAVENGITSGTGNRQFSPNNTCTRGEIVTFLYRAMG